MLSYGGLRCHTNPSVHVPTQDAAGLQPDDTATSTSKSLSVSTTNTCVIVTPTNDMAVRGKSSALIFYYYILCVSSARAKADSLPPRKCITFYRWQTAVQTTRTTSWRYVRAAIQRLRSAAATRARIHTRSDPVGVILPL